MLCLLVNAFKEKPIDYDFDTWFKIQAFINHNINKFT